MPLRPFFLALPCLCLAAAPARAASPPGAPGADARDSLSASAPAGRKLVPGGDFDGHTFLGLGNPGPGWAGVASWSGGMVGRWNPSFLGWEARLAAAVAVLSASPPGNSTGYAESRPTRVDYELDEAWLRYPLTVAGWRTAFQAGLFRWRSHSDAALAGEYLARWGDYPVQILRPGMAYEPLDSLTTSLPGLRFALASPGRAFAQELLAFTEVRAGIRFIKWIASTTFAPLPGLELGIGAALPRALKTRHLTAPEAPSRQADTPYVLVDTVTGGGVSYYTFGSNAYSARLTLDLPALIAGASRKDRGGRFYAEAAVLGWESYDPYYSDRSRRIQGCAGLYLPAFGILDVLRLQAERRSFAGESPFSHLGKQDPQWWHGQVFLARALLPWLDLQGRVLYVAGRKAASGYVRVGSPVPVSTNPTQDPGFEIPTPAWESAWSCEARISARL